MIKAEERTRCVVLYEGKIKLLSNMREDFTNIEYFIWNDFMGKKVWEILYQGGRWRGLLAPELKRNAVF